VKNYKITEDGVEYTVIETKNFKHWILNDKFHRENGPASEWTDGYIAWYKHGIIHREDGPAIIYSTGLKHYYLNGVLYPDITSNEEWIKLVPIINIIT
jgi:hypothetical protein